MALQKLTTFNAIWEFPPHFPPKERCGIPVFKSNMAEPSFKMDKVANKRKSKFNTEWCTEFLEDGDLVALMANNC